MSNLSRGKVAIFGWAHSPFDKPQDPDVESLIGRVAPGALDQAGIGTAAIANNVSILERMK